MGSPPGRIGQALAWLEAIASGLPPGVEALSDEQLTLLEACTRSGGCFSTPFRTLSRSGP